MSELLPLHDATLLEITLDWSSKTCTLTFEGAPSVQQPFIVEWTEVQQLIVPRSDSWGPSVSVLSLELHEPDRYELQMQSGDLIVVVSRDRPTMRLQPT